VRAKLGSVGFSRSRVRGRLDSHHARRDQPVIVERISPVLAADAIAARNLPGKGPPERVVVIGFDGDDAVGLQRIACQSIF